MEKKNLQEIEIFKPNFFGNLNQSRSPKNTALELLLNDAC